MTDTTALPAEALRAIAAALAAPDATPEQRLAPIADHLIGAHGLKLVTVTARDPADGSFLRLYSSQPGAYAAQGRKPANETDWSRHVIDEHKTFVANDYESLAKAMFDHEQIRALGMESIVNIPVVVTGEVIGTLNCLAGPGHFDDAIVAGCEAMRLPVAAALLAGAMAG